MGDRLGIPGAVDIFCPHSDSSIAYHYYATENTTAMGMKNKTPRLPAESGNIRRCIQRAIAYLYVSLYVFVCVKCC